ncbi:hypothetical protein C6P46_006052 [Rhodotorula mucilaginosa]|uniref:MARVEL domain-containing protein n=1 Tax=Rhodotorula mucilaginosa TaxID=5537 RepID=A0A9P7B4R9_RHOMI|nr:hypothetical protein C6P46_006052 [Rhodotorula mucilaginosa]TKA58320.1 hypothetical protein B0A53_00058 [Rhodotorula sp. CCFEE 5036]
MQRQSPDAPPPPYALQRFLPSTTRRTNLRNVVLVIAFFSAIWALIVGASYLRSRNRDSLPASLAMPYLVLAILYFVCTAIEIFGIAAAYRASVPLVRAYFWAAATSAVVVSACEVVRTTLHFTKKGEIVAACIDSYSTDVARGTYSNSDVSSFCNDSWRNSSYVDIAILVFTFFISFFFASVAASFLHQLQHPETLRTQVAQAASSQYAYPLRPFDSNLPPPMYPQGGQHQQPLPSYDNPYGVSVSEEKFSSSEAPERTGYAPPPGPPPPGVAASNPNPIPNPFADQVEHQGQGRGQGGGELVRRPGETADEFEQRQHEHDHLAAAGVYDLEAGRDDAFASTETVTLEPREAARRA